MRTTVYASLFERLASLQTTRAGAVFCTLSRIADDMQINMFVMAPAA